ncbi:MAG: GNAT family N-acetyltransferase [Anaerolineae bacterium]|nr:GNAT family N-acetyltransferase [Anaerolineae bacterium]
MAGADRLPGIAALRAPDSPSTDLLEMLASPDATIGEWGSRVMVLRAEGLIVGDVGFHSPPNAAGEVEIGYSVAPGFRGRGLAAEAVRALTAWAFSSGAQAVIAHCDRTNLASDRVLARCGFMREGESDSEMAWRLRPPVGGTSSYDYPRRRGELPISWGEFATLYCQLADEVAALGVDAVVGIARAGLIPATAVACALRLDLFPVRVTRREGDVVTRQHPVWKVPLSPDVAGRRVAVVDEIADTGETLALVADEARRLGAEAVYTACLVQHTWAHPRPDLCALVSDALVVFPWDAQVRVDGVWRPHPEIEAARRAQTDDT